MKNTFTHLSSSIPHPLCKQLYYDLGISKVVFPEGDTIATLLISAFSSTSFGIGT